ncbi:30S ribosomal protein S16 [Streptomyces canus]|uniref:30S ribosomal protein S16 n=1 Tax=Streptomyces canus TaxID=58343 RepID=UPI00324FFACC
MAVKIKLKRLGKIRSPHYRIVVADSRTRRDGRAIEEIGLYHPVQNPSRIEVDGDRVAYWLGVGAQPTEPVLAILKKTGDWQKFKGEPAPAPLLQPAEKAARPSFEALGGDDEGKGEAITQKKKTEKKDEAAAESGSTEA